MSFTTMELPPPLRVAVVGGGIAGLSAALAFVKAQEEQSANIEVKVYEGANEFKEIGAGVSFGPNAQRALRLMGSGAALDKVAADPGSDHDLWFEFVCAEKGEDEMKSIAVVRGKDAAKGNVHRADFLDELIRRVPSNMAHFNHRIESYHPHADGVTLNFANGATAEADVLVASDGIKSRVRQCMYERRGWDLEKQKAKYSEWVAWRGLVPRERFEQVFGQGARDKMMLCGQGRHILHFPVRNGELINIVGFVQDPEHRKLGGHTGPWSEERPKAEMMDDFNTFSDRVLQLLDYIEKPSIWGIFELPDIETCVDERVVLIGDASHATTPHQGAGAGQALEDALFIAPILASHSVASAHLTKRASAIQRGLEIYERKRHERGVRVKRTSREAGLLYEFLGVKGEGRDLEAVGENLLSRMGWIWEWDTEGELGSALEELQRSEGAASAGASEASRAPV